MNTRSVLLLILMVMPWLNPFAAGPSAAVQPALVTLFMAAGVLWLYRSEDTSRIAQAWVIAGLVNSVIALCQYLGWAHNFAPWMNQTAVGEAFGNLRQRNQLATLTNMAQAVLVFWVVTQKYKVQVWLWAGSALLAAATAFSASRTGLLQLLFLALLTWYWCRQCAPQIRRQAAYLLACAALSYGLASLVLPSVLGPMWMQQGIWGRFGYGQSPCESRLLLWANVLELIAQKPWLGWGWGELDYAHYITAYTQPRFCAILDNAHNLPLHLAVELGVPTAMLFCAVLGYLVWRSRPWQQINAQRQMACNVLVLIALHSLLEYPLWYGPFQLALVFCCLLLRPASSGSWANSALIKLGRKCVAVSLVVLGVVLSISYHRVSQAYLPMDQRDAAYRDDPLSPAVVRSVFFKDAVRFAQLNLTPLTEDNAPAVHAMALMLLHYSPEPCVIEKVIASAQLLGLTQEVHLHAARYQAAFNLDSSVDRLPLAGKPHGY